MPLAGAGASSVRDTKRVIVAPQAELFGLFSLFGAAQARVGATPPLLARSMDIALMQFGLGKLNFRPIEAPWKQAP